MKIKPEQKLTLTLRVKICIEVLTKRSEHGHQAQVKGLSVFECGYSSGFLDAMPKIKTEPIFKNDVV